MISTRHTRVQANETRANFQSHIQAKPAMFSPLGRFAKALFPEQRTVFLPIYLWFDLIQIISFLPVGAECMRDYVHCFFMEPFSVIELVMERKSKYFIVMGKLFGVS